VCWGSSRYVCTVSAAGNCHTRLWLNRGCACVGACPHQAQLRAAVYTAIDEQERGNGIHLHDERLEALRSDAEHAKAVNLVIEFLTFYNLDATLSCLLPEIGFVRAVVWRLRACNAETSIVNEQLLFEARCLHFFCAVTQRHPITDKHSRVCWLERILGCTTSGGVAQTRWPSINKWILLSHRGCWCWGGDWQRQHGANAGFDLRRARSASHALLQTRTPIRHTHSCRHSRCTLRLELSLLLLWADHTCRCCVSHPPSCLRTL